MRNTYNNTNDLKITLTNGIITAHDLPRNRNLANFKAKEGDWNSVFYMLSDLSEGVRTFRLNDNGLNERGAAELRITIDNGIFKVRAPYTNKSLFEFEMKDGDFGYVLNCLQKLQEKRGATDWEGLELEILATFEDGSQELHSETDVALICNIAKDIDFATLHFKKALNYDTELTKVSLCLNRCTEHIYNQLAEEWIAEENGKLYYA